MSKRDRDKELAETIPQWQFKALVANLEHYKTRCLELREELGECKSLCRELEDLRRRSQNAKA